MVKFYEAGREDGDRSGTSGEKHESNSLLLTLYTVKLRNSRSHRSKMNDKLGDKTVRLHLTSGDTATPCLNFLLPSQISPIVASPKQQQSAEEQVK